MRAILGILWIMAVAKAETGEFIGIGIPQQEQVALPILVGHQILILIQERRT